MFVDKFLSFEIIKLRSSPQNDALIMVLVVAEHFAIVSYDLYVDFHFAMKIH